jgi:molybdopterin-guanine dinucleotide biosynthesis protein A
MSTLGKLGAEAVWICGRSDQTYFPAASLIVDAWPEAGPLGGIASGLARMDAPLMAVLGVDLPGVTVEIFQALLAACSERQGAVFRGEKFYEPLVAVYPQGMLASAETMLNAGNHRLQTWVQDAVLAGQLAVVPLPEAWRPAFRNLNTPEDLVLRPDHG